jgi:lipopolysaccharide export system permease protein
MKILDRYLSAELILPFLAGLAGFVLIEIGTILFNQILEVMLQAHTPVRLVLLHLLYDLPQFIVYALPIAMLFGVSLGVNRMAREGEITAMRMAGVPLRRLLLPLLVVGLTVSAADFLIEEKVAPAAGKKAQEIYQLMWYQSTLPQIQADVFFHADNYWFYLGSVSKTGDNRFFLKNIMAYQLQGGRYPILLTAEKGETDGSNWVLYNGRRIEIANQEQFLDFKRMTLRLKQTLQQFMTAQRQPEQMSSEELGKMIRQFAQANIPAKSLVMYYQLKYSIPVGCLVVALVSMPLAIRFSRSGSYVGVFLSIVLFFFYYNTYFLFRLLGGANFLPPLVAAWGHNVIFAVLGLVMLWREE